MQHALSAKRILIPVDFSDEASDALTTGVRLAASLQADVWVLYVSPPLKAFDFNKRTFVNTRDTIERIEDGVHRRLNELWDHGGLEAVDRRRVQVVIRGGKAAQEIVSTALEKNIELIVMGTRDPVQRSPFSGSTAERVLHHAPCSVFCVRERTDRSDALDDPEAKAA